MRIIFIILFLYSCNKETKLTSVQYSNVHAGRLPVIVLAGQSNMIGRDTVSIPPAEFTGPIEGALLFYNGSLETLEFGKNNKYFGPEISMAYYLNKSIGIVKYAIGGSELVQGNRTQNGVWQVGAINSLYSILVSNYVIPGLNTFRANGYNPYVAAFVWCQGEADSQDSLYVAEQYKSKLKQLISRFMIDVPEANNMEVIFIRTTNQFINSSTVRNAQVSIANSIPANHGHWINSDKFSLFDYVHYSKAGEIEAGRQIANILK